MQYSKLAIAVFDIIDFEGSFDDEILDVLREMDSIVVVNKLDLIPDDKHPSEVAEEEKAGARNQWSCWLPLEEARRFPAVPMSAPFPPEGIGCGGRN